ncbi:DUF3606 domain-containing protein [Leptospira wolffii]|uniref:DUF3606 domain-containing protein n=1 Tax=Leptospira wolffii TaxID=409998 RepID=A0A2M9Z721_9LEPT|nr:DUF3606 domain-containing protein [Leptospira wolffii]PJZ64122.1 DUF3606 domain-containing protein [Leptospira wolffii]
MTDDLKRKQPEDPNKINVNQDWEIEYWIDALKTSKNKLKQAVDAVGPLVKDVKSWLDKNK